MKTLKVLVVGAGFTGASAARTLADAGVSVTVIDQRPNIGGNAQDWRTESGVYVHAYGPHLFHTNSKAVVDFLSRFTEWIPYEHRVVAVTDHIDNKSIPTTVKLPVIKSTINSILKTSAETPEELQRVLDDAVRKTEGYPLGSTLPENSYQVAMNTVGKEITQALFAGYTHKQWGRPLSELSTRVISRIPVRLNDDDRYFVDDFQALPKLGYTTMFQLMLGHENISLKLNTKFHPVLHLQGDFDAVIHTGPLDEYYKFQFGSLEYRGMVFKWSKQASHFTGVEKMAFDLGVVTVNFTSILIPATRVTNFGKLPCSADVPYMCTEFPSEGSERYYPVPTQANLDLYRKYADFHESFPSKVVFAGRLGTYKYLNMDQACANGIKVAKDILARRA